MTAKQKAWITLVALVFATGCIFIGGAVLGGCKVWVAILLGVGHAAESVLQRFGNSPEDVEGSGSTTNPRSAPAATVEKIS